MNKPIAPKDMSLGELLEEYKAERKCALCKYDQYCTTKEPLILGRTETIPSCMSGRIWMERKMNEPAPNPFTPDQLAWMREEQRAGFGYAALNSNGLVYSYKTMPRKDKMNLWVSDGKSTSTHAGFLANYLSFSDPEPLCFADYAPLEGEPK